MAAPPRKARRRIVVRPPKAGRAAWNDPDFDPFRDLDRKPILISHDEYPELCRFALKSSVTRGDPRRKRALGAHPNLTSWPGEFRWPSRLAVDAQGAFGDVWPDEETYDRDLAAFLAGPLERLPPELVREWGVPEPADDGSDTAGVKIVRTDPPRTLSPRELKEDCRAKVRAFIKAEPDLSLSEACRRAHLAMPGAYTGADRETLRDVPNALYQAMLDDDWYKTFKSRE